MLTKIIEEWSIVSIALYLFLNTRVPANALVAPSRTTAVFHESPDQQGEKISYREDTAGWSNLEKMFTTIDLTPALVCVSGAWLLYEKTGFRANKDDEVKLISGNENCIPSPHGIRSMQPITPPTFSKGGSIALFSQVNFGSTAQIVSEGESRQGGLKQLEGKMASIGSIIIYGDTPWSIISTSGKILCIKPTPKDSQEAGSICYGRNFLSVQIPDFHVDAVYPECPDDQDDAFAASVKLTDCKKFGSENIEALKTLAIMGRSAGGSLGAVAIECPQNTGEEAPKTKITLGEEETKLMQKLIKIRIFHNFMSREQLLWPDDEANIWKTVPLDIAFDIVIATVPETIVSIPYLQRIREFTIFHLNELWKAEGGGGGSNGTSPDKNKLLRWRNHKVIVHMLSKCLQMVTINAIKYQMLTTEAYNSVGTLADFLNKIHPDFVMNMDYDPVIETAWLASNYVMAVCHSAFEYNINFWDNYATTFFNMYFGPLEERWKDPTQISPLAFRTVLTGFGTLPQYRRLALATTQMFELTPNLTPMERFDE